VVPGLLFAATTVFVSAVVRNDDGWVTIGVVMIGDGCGAGWRQLWIWRGLL